MHRYFNKPFGFHEWLMDKKDSIYESIIVLIDPDMIMLKPFLFHIKEEAERIAIELQKTTTETENRKPKLRDLYVREGHPVSQKYGIGGKWVKWTGFCDERESCNVSERDAWRWYSVGPPYMLHKNDWLKVTPKWIEYSPAALKWEPQPSILAEMYSFVIACAYYDLKNEYLFSMISGPTSSVWMENWYDLQWNWLSSANILQNNVEFNFHVLHYCHGYWLGKSRNHGTIRNGGWNWHKGHVPVDYLYNCNIPLLVEMNDFGLENMSLFTRRDSRQDDLRHTWMLHHIISFVNHAVLNYRMKYCVDVRENGPIYGLVLQQPESDVRGRRMNYVLNKYENTSLSWRGA